MPILVSVCPHTLLSSSLSILNRRGARRRCNFVACLRPDSPHYGRIHDRGVRMHDLAYFQTVRDRRRRNVEFLQKSAARSSNTSPIRRLVLSPEDPGKKHTGYNSPRSPHELRTMTNAPSFIRRTTLINTSSFSCCVSPTNAASHTTSKPPRSSGPSASAQEKDS